MSLIMIVLTLHSYVSPRFSQHITGAAWVISKIFQFDLSDQKCVPVSLLLHVSPAIRIQQHGVLVPKDISHRLRIHHTNQLHLMANTGVNRGAFRFNFGLVWKGEVFILFGLWMCRFELPIMSKWVKKWVMSINNFTHWLIMKCKEISLDWVMSKNCWVLCCCCCL